MSAFLDVPRGTPSRMSGVNDSAGPAETPGTRLYLIRLACGDGLRRALSQAAFAKRVLDETGVWYDPSTISLLERMEQGWTLDDLQTFASVDPKGRGPAWLAWGDQGGRAEPRPQSDIDVEIPRPTGRHEGHRQA